MKFHFIEALILNNFYSVRDSLNLALILSIVATTLLMSSGNPIALKVALYLSMALMMVGAFEVLKQDSLSGWDKFEFILLYKLRIIVKRALF